ncbi:MAG: hypothetical protein R6V61_02805 [Wenzhouxiangellaceae bacterium]
MTGRQFTETGLHKLSPEELAALNQWIRERSLAEYEGPPEDDGNTAAPPSQPGEAPEIERMAREKFQSRIVGEFSGWSGNTRFELENGMVWKQDERDRLRMQPVESPVVTITPGAFGVWRLSIEGYNRSVRVERIE